MAKEEKKAEKHEREYIIPLREKCRVVPRYKKTNKAIKTIKEFLVRHMKIRDKDLNKIKLDMFLNEAMWKRGIRNPPHKIKVKATKEGEIVKVELAEMPEKLKFKKARLEKREQKAIKKKPKKVEEPKEEIKKEEEKTEEELKEESEKKAAVVEVGEQIEKSAAKEAKHKSKEIPRQQPRKMLMR
jgi:large subunit ribosomal protein L31e